MKVSDSKAAVIVILTGPPGAGKSTIANALVKTFDSPGVHLQADDFWHFIKQGYIPPYLPEAHNQNGVVIDALASTTRCYARAGYFVVVDGVIGPWFLGRFRKIVGTTLHYVVLRPDFETTMARAQARPDSALKEREAIENLYKQFAALGNLERHVVDTSTHLVIATLDAVRRGISNELFQLG